MIASLNKWNQRFPVAFPVLVAAILSALHALYLLGGRHYDLHIPFATGGDGLYHLMLAKRVISEDGYLFNSSLGFPFGSSLYDFPGSDSLSLLFLYVAGKLTSSYVVAFNAYYFIGYPLAALSFAWMARKMGANGLASVIGGLLFTFLPFHFLRLNHLYYTWYFVVPVFIWYGWRIYGFGRDGNQTIKRGGWVFAGVGLVALASLGIYYTVFGMIVLLTAGFVASVEAKSFRSMGLAAISVVLLAITVLANTAPNLIYTREHGANREVAKRSPEEAELYGLKISQLILPNPNHRNGSLRKVTQLYGARYPLVNENASSTLGAIGALGFLGLLGSLIFEKRSSPSLRPQRYLAILVFVILLTATIGGFSSIFSLLVSPLIRGWNRISIFVAAISILASMLAISWAFLKAERFRFGTPIAIAASIFVLIFGVWDETGPRCDLGCVNNYRGHFVHEHAFFQKVQSSVPKGSAIYTLPFMAFPETPPKEKLETYALVAGYLHTEGLKWSYGAMKGRDKGSALYQELETRPATEQISRLKSLGFKGILIDRRGYPGSVASIEEELIKTGAVTLTAEQDFRAFYVLKP